MNSNIINSENVLIKNSIEDINKKIESLKLRLEKIDSNTPFTDSLGENFHGGRVGYMSKKDNARKEKEFEKFLDSCNDKKSINSEILSLEKKLKKLTTGNYLIRKNGLLVDSYNILSGKKAAYDMILKTNQLKGKSLNNEDLKIVKDLRRENLSALNKREKQYKTI